MKIYINYLKYILEHKKNVFIECWKDKQYIHAFTHDLSKFSPIEFINYAKNFYGDEREKKYNNFNYAWLHHQRKNKHHWDYWVNGNGVALDIPQKYIDQMICDWKAMSRKFGDTPQSFYKNNRNKMNLSTKTRCNIEFTLGFIDSGCFCSLVTWDDYLKLNNVDEEVDFFNIMVNQANKNN